MQKKKSKALWSGSTLITFHSVKDMIFIYINSEFYKFGFLEKLVVLDFIYIGLSRLIFMLIFPFYVFFFLKFEKLHSKMLHQYGMKE